VPARARWSALRSHTQVGVVPHGYPVPLAMEVNMHAWERGDRAMAGETPAPPGAPGSAGIVPAQAMV